MNKENKIFITSLVVSLALHYAILFTFPVLPRIAFFNLKSLNKLEVTYFNVKGAPKPDILIQQKIGKPSNVSIDQPVVSVGQPVMPAQNKIQNSQIKKEVLAERSTKIKTEKAIKEVFNTYKPVISDIKTDLTIKGGPAGNSYYKIVREKIRKAAILNQPKDFQEGRVYISFSIKKDGLLDGLELVNSMTSAPAALKDIAIKSVRDASPFPPFPNELRQDSINFGIMIMFTRED